VRGGGDIAVGYILSDPPRPASPPSPSRTGRPSGGEEGAAAVPVAPAAGGRVLNPPAKGEPRSWRFDDQVKERGSEGERERGRERD
jgi:hypothetical protein